MSRHKEPVVLVTGAARRIGATIARHLHAAGYRLALHYGASRREAEDLAHALNHRRPGSAVLFQADLRDLAQVERLAREVTKHFEGVDALVNNASSFHPTPLATSTEALWDELMGSNLKGPFFLSRALAESLRTRRGRIVNITDINARQPLKEYPIYCIAKAGVEMMTRSLALELAPHVQVNGIAPGSIIWPEGDAAMSEADKADLLPNIPLQRNGAPADIAALALHLVRDPGYITGQVIAVDGGLRLRGPRH